MPSGAPVFVQVMKSGELATWRELGLLASM